MSVLSIAGRHVTAAGNTIDLPDWSDLFDLHAWDFAHTHVVGGRAVKVSDPVGHKPLRKMPGTFPLLGADINTYGPLPGPLYIPSSARFGGRPAVFFDPFPTQGALFNLFAGLSPNVNAAGTTGPEDTANYFAPPVGYPQPYWVAVLGRLGLPDNPEGGAEDPAGVWDATHGGVGTGPTIGRKIVGLGAPNWQVSNFGPGLLLVTVAHTASPDETVLLLCCVNGASSFLEVNWRDSGGTLRTLRQTGTLLGWNYLECFGGWVHGPHLALVGIGSGVPPESHLDRVRRMASYWIPPAAVLPDEP